MNNQLINLVIKVSTNYKLRLSVRFSHLVLQGAYTLYFYFHDIPRLHFSNTCRSAGGNHIAFIQGHDMGYELHKNWWIKYHIIDNRVLFHFSVNTGTDVSIWQVDFPWFDNIRTKGCKCVKTLGPGPLVIYLLDVPDSLRLVVLYALSFQCDHNLFLHVYQ